LGHHLILDECQLGLILFLLQVISQALRFEHFRQFCFSMTFKKLPAFNSYPFSSFLRQLGIFQLSLIF